MGTLKHRIVVAGIGPGSPEYMVPAAKKAIESAKYLVGGRRALSQYAKASGGQQTCAVTRDIDGVMAFVHEGLDKADVVVMVSGDPGVFSLLDALTPTSSTSYRVSARSSSRFRASPCRGMTRSS